MKISNLALAAALAVTATGAFAETGVYVKQVDNVANVYGRAGVPNLKIAGPVVARPDEAVPSGPNTEPGPTAVAIGTGNSDVNAVQGRS